VWTSDCTSTLLRASLSTCIRSLPLVTAGVEMDVLGIDYTRFTDSDRNAVVQAFPRTGPFQRRYPARPSTTASNHKPETTFGNVKADVLADKDPGFHRGNFCGVIR